MAYRLGSFFSFFDEKRYPSIMQEDTKELKERLINRIQVLDDDELVDVESFINDLKIKERPVGDVLSFAGAWDDIDDKVFSETKFVT